MRCHTAAARLAVGLASLALLVSCTGGAANTPPPAATQQTPAAQASSTPPPSPLGTPGPSSSAATSPMSDRAWYSIGALPAPDTELHDVVGFDGGYVAVERSSPSVWFSADGRAWTEVELPFKVTKDEFGRPHEAYASGLATNGKEVLAFGGYTHDPCDPPEEASTGGGPECPLYPLAWVSDDGVTWESGYPGTKPPDPSGYDQGSEFVAAWPVPSGGWDASLSYWQGESLTGRGLWHSSDGIRWTELEPAPAPDTTGSDEFPWIHAGAADQAGNRVVWQRWGNGEPLMTLATSPDGRSWTTIDDFAGQGTNVNDGVAPFGTLGRWVLVGASGITEEGYSTAVPTIWTSLDGVSWTAVAVPFVSGPDCLEDGEDCGGWATAVALTEAGYVAVSGGPYGPPTYGTWLSEDGATWVELPPAATPAGKFGPNAVADGPAGVIGIGLGPTDSGDTATVWELR